MAVEQACLELDIASHPKFVLDRIPEIVEVEVAEVGCIHRSVGRSMVGAEVGCIHRSVGRSMGVAVAAVAVVAAVGGSALKESPNSVVGVEHLLEPDTHTSSQSILDNRPCMYILT